MSRFSAKVTYGIMATVELARHDREIPLHAKAIATRQGIPYRFIEQILQGLKQAGIVRSLRGAQGGYTLAQDPRQITLAELVHSLDGTEATPATGNGSPAPTEPRGALNTILSGILEQVQEAEQTILRVISLQSLVEQQQKLESQRSLMYHI
ncbi:MAG: Rrf2 family transcriptional regulator [Nitrospirota bacterium]|nr:Rrf2 family transcriptional regulator [Nitrospirota bacterium]MDH5773497.1 Rrf2 family transcriptional regulator [Nitrospirota bacterium]